jgi:hypothetical protein
MKKVILAFTILASSFALASGGHFHPKKVAKCEATCGEEQIKAAVPTAIKELANWKKLDSKWETAKIESVTKKEFTKGSKLLKTWVVSLLDEKETDQTKNKAYLFFLEDGSIFRTNTTGELK